MENNALSIDVTGLCKTFGDKQVVSNVNLQVHAGEIFGFLGPNGSGKTTTIRMLCGLLKPNKGTGHCLGYDILTESLLIKLQVGYMTQHFSLYDDLSIRENLDFIARIYQAPNRKQLVNDCVDQLGFSQQRQKQLAGTLSGGWKQRLSLAAAMLHKPKLLLLDEPTAGVDPQARREFWNTIHELSDQGITALVSTHYMDEAERCHRVAYIAYGRLLTTGAITDVIQNSHLFMWTVSGEELNLLGKQLKEKEGVEQVTPFGRTLHITGKNPDALERAIAPFRTSNYIWNPAAPTLEDVFISLVAEAKDNFS